MNKKDLTIGFVLTWMSADNPSGGVFQYAERLLNALVKYTDLNVIAVVSKKIVETLKQLKEYKNFKEIIINRPERFPQILTNEGIQVVHTPLPINNLYTTSVPMIISLHDIQHIHNLNNFSKNEIKFREKYYKKSSQFCESIIVSYDHVKNDIVKHYKIEPDKIDVCPFGIDPPLIVNGCNFDDIKEKYHLPDKYLFYSANTWKHKNHIGLIRAIKLASLKYGKHLNLVCTGQIYEDYFSEISKEIAENNLNNRILFLGYIPEEDLISIMKNALLVVIPTLYEAGSLPLIEAMNYGVPVICSNATSLPQQIGDSRFVFNPTDIDEIAAKIYSMTDDEELRQKNIENSIIRMEQLRWPDKIMKFVDSYQNAIVRFDKKKNRFNEEFVSNYEFFINDFYERTFIKCHQEAKEIQNLLNKKIENMENTLSWKITSPLRNSSVLRKIMRLVTNKRL